MDHNKYVGDPSRNVMAIDQRRFSADGIQLKQKHGENEMLPRIKNPKFDTFLFDIQFIYLWEKGENSKNAPRYWWFYHI